MGSWAHPMPSDDPGLRRAVGVWGARAYAWSGEERPRAAGFPVDVTGRQRVLGFPGGASPPGEPGRLLRPREPRPEKSTRARLVFGIVAILGGRDAGQSHARA